MIENLPKNKGSGKAIICENPSTNEKITEIKTYTEEEAKDALQRSRTAQKAWDRIGIDKRRKVLTKFQHLLCEEAEEVCRLISLENGKPLQESMQTEVFPVLSIAGYFLKNGKKILSDKPIPISIFKHRRSFVHYRPRGVMLVISPWNYPFSIPTGNIVMGLLAGNTVIHKPASLTPLIALKTRELMDRAGVPEDVYQVVPTSGRIASKIIETGVDYVNFTGSTQVGLMVSELCGRKMIPCTMELGGKDPAIVCPDANTDQAAASIVFGGLTNAGQTCASVERVYAHESVYDELVEKVVERVKKLRVGNPLKGDTDIGPMVDPGQLEIVKEQVEDAVAKGAKVLCGGKPMEGPGRFFAPTVLTNVDETMRVVHEETFGPLIPIMKIASIEEGIQKANDSEYGLSAYVYTKNQAYGRQIAKQLEAGTVMINEALVTFAIPETPWQGVKMSGMGKSHSDEGLRGLCYPYHVNENGMVKLAKSPFWQPYSRKMFHLLIAGANMLYGPKKLKPIFRAVKPEGKKLIPFLGSSR